MKRIAVFVVVIMAALAFAVVGEAGDGKAISQKTVPGNGGRGRLGTRTRTVQVRSGPATFKPTPGVTVNAPETSDVRVKKGVLGLGVLRDRVIVVPR